MVDHNLIATYKKGNKSIKIFIDDDYMENPRLWDNLGKMICFHRRYDLGDKHNLKRESFNDWSDMFRYIEKELKGWVILPLYLLDHSGITISTNDFGDKWDSGRVGYIYCTKEDMIKAFNRPKNKTMPEDAFKAKEILISEVKTYDMYLRREVYGYVLYRGKKEIESCWGFYGMDTIMEEVRIKLGKDFIKNDIDKS